MEIHSILNYSEYLTILKMHGNGYLNTWARWSAPQKWCRKKARFILLLDQFVLPD